MISDIQWLEVSGWVRRPVAELAVPAEQWRAGIEMAAGGRGWDVQTFHVNGIDPGSGRRVEEVHAVRTRRRPAPRSG
jgi:hypothetical protein